MGWTLELFVGSVGLGLAAAVAFVLLRIWRREPVISYKLLCAVLVASLLLPLGQAGLQASGLAGSLPFVGRLARALPTLTTAEETTPVASVEESASPEDVLLVVTATEPSRAQLEEEELMLDLLVLTEMAAAGDEEAQAFLTAQGEAGTTTDVVAREEDEAGALAALLGTLRSVDRERVLWSLAGIYVLGLLWSLARTGLRLVRTRRLIRGAEPTTDAHVLAVWNEVLSGSPLEGRVSLLTTPEIAAPMCYGLGRPAVLLPASEEPKLAPEVLSCVLLHELVHLERKDTWVMLGQELLRAMFWFHPAAWWLAQRIDALRELSCDHLVVKRTGRRKRYASALVEYAAWMRRGLELPTAGSSMALLPWTTSNSQLARRIEMLVSLSGKRRRSRATVFAAASAFTALWGGQLALAAAIQEPAQDEQDEREVQEVEVVEVADADVAEILELVDAIELDATEEGDEISDLLLQLAKSDGQDEVDENVFHGKVRVDGGSGAKDMQFQGRVEIVDEDGRQVFEFDDPEELNELREKLGDLGNVFELQFGGQNGENPFFALGDLDIQIPELDFSELDFAELPEFDFAEMDIELPQLESFGGSGKNVFAFPGGSGQNFAFATTDDTPMIGFEYSPEDGYLVVRRVLDGSVAEKSGLQDGDVIFEVNGRKASESHLFEAKKHMTAKGIQLHVKREGDVFLVEIDPKAFAKGDAKAKAKWKAKAKEKAKNEWFQAGDDKQGWIFESKGEPHVWVTDDEGKDRVRSRVFRIESDGKGGQGFVLQSPGDGGQDVEADVEILLEDENGKRRTERRRMVFGGNQQDGTKRRVMRLRSGDGNVFLLDGDEDAKELKRKVLRLRGNGGNVFFGEHDDEDRADGNVFWHRADGDHDSDGNVFWRKVGDDDEDSQGNVFWRRSSGDDDEEADVFVWSSKNGQPGQFRMRGLKDGQQYRVLFDDSMNRAKEMLEELGRDGRYGRDMRDAYHKAMDSMRGGQNGAWRERLRDAADGARMRLRRTPSDGGDVNERIEKLRRELEERQKELMDLRKRLHELEAPRKDRRNDQVNFPGEVREEVLLPVLR